MTLLVDLISGLLTFKVKWAGKRCVYIERNPHMALRAVESSTKKGRIF